MEKVYTHIIIEWTCPKCLIDNRTTEGHYNFYGNVDECKICETAVELKVGKLKEHTKDIKED